MGSLFNARSPHRAPSVKSLAGRLTVVLLAVSLWTESLSARNADLDRAIVFNIEPQSIDSALITFSEQAHIQVVIAPDANSSTESPSIHGTVSPRKALDALLERSGLKYVAVGESVSVTAGGDFSPEVSSPGETGKMLSVGSIGNAEGATDVPEKEVAKKGSTAGQQGEGANRLPVVIVTAEKRTERLQDVPVPVTALSADTLIEGNQLRLQDYFSQVPGLSYTTDIRGSPSISIRGLMTATDFANPTVGIIVDDVPFGSSTGLGGGSSAPDIDPSELERIEVLRGPQGTLYGANTLGGLIKFVSVDPSTDRVSGRVEAGTSGVYNGVQAGYNFRGAVNIPIGDTLAMRASGFARRDPGYIDNVLTGENGINRVTAEGGRITALWKPSDVFSLKLGALYQYSRADGANSADITDHYAMEAPLGDLQQSEARGTGSVDRRNQVYTSTAVLKLGAMELKAISGYNISEISDSLDFSAPYDGFYASEAELYFGVRGSELADNPRTKRFTQEILLSAPIATRIDWLLGAFYSHEQTAYIQRNIAVNPNTGENAGLLGTFDFPSTFTEYAAFTDLTFRLTDRFDVQIGGRESRNKQTYSEVDSGLAVGGVFVEPEVDTRDNSFTYLVTPRFEFSSDLMVYARLASGYRPGGPNSGCVILGVPCEYAPDKTSNYEVGVKGDIADHTVDFDASLYYIDWKNIQLSLAQNGITYYANGGEAKSQGVELSVAMRPVQGLKIAGWFSFNVAVLTQDFPAAAGGYGLKGNGLPFASRLSGSLSVDDEFALGGKVMGFGGASVNYIGDRPNSFTSASQGIPPQQNLPGFARADVHAGARYDSWTVDVFINNVFDKRGLLSGGNSGGFFSFDYIQPRTVGLLLSKSF